jgi:hypothetical protein
VNAFTPDEDVPTGGGLGTGGGAPDAAAVGDDGRAGAHAGRVYLRACGDGWCFPPAQ